MAAPDSLGDRREFFRSAGRAVLFGLLLVTGGYLLLKPRRSRATGRACVGPNECASCPELRGCDDPTAVVVGKVTTGNLVWQLDPRKCVQCGQCATNCVLNPSAVKCVHSYAICGYCKLCFGYFQPGVPLLTESAENQLCPVGAIGRTFIENPYYQYTIDETLCVGCGKCVKGCTTFGNGSLYLQVRHNRCLNCNECSIARNCPSGAYERVPAGQPYILKAEADP
jgi:electron transport complex protein RnfB